MKKIISAAILSALIATPTFADDTSSKMTAKKPAHAMQSGHKKGKNMSDMREECEHEHEIDGHHEYRMMEGHSVDMMDVGMNMIWSLNLNEDQKSKIYKLSDELKHNNWATQGSINDETAKLRDLYDADKRDPAVIGKEYQKIFDLKRQMIEEYLNTQNRIDELLTVEQRAEMKNSHHDMHHMHEYE